MTIQEILANIQNKTYGEDVRQAIINGISLCYSERALGGYNPISDLNTFYNGSGLFSSSTAHIPSQSSYLVMSAGTSTNCCQIAINTGNLNLGYIRKKQNSTWEAWARIGMTKKLRYWNYDGTELLYTERVESGNNGTWAGTSTKESTPQYDYTFLGWSTSKNASAADANAVKNITADRDVYAAFSSTVRSYNVYFYNGSTLLFTDVVEYGSAAAFEGTTPTKDSTAQYSYTFAGWNSQDGQESAETGVLNNITGEKTVYAAFSSTVRSYNVYFYNGSTLLFTDVVEYGSAAAYEGNNPTKDSTAQYSYTFAGWNSQDEQESAETGVLNNITGEKTVYAAFSSTIRTYTVRFMNGTAVLQTVNDVPYGGSASYTGETPQHPTDPDDYTFAGFNPDGTNITGPTDCQAVYILNPEEIHYWNYDGTELLHTELVEHGGDGAWTGTSTRERDSDYIYTFIGWSTSKNATAADPTATQDVLDDREVYAAFSRIDRYYTVTFINGAVTLGTETVEYDNNATASEIETPTKPSTDQYDYTFVGWNSQNNQETAELTVLTHITANKTVYAAFSSAIRSYNVYFYNGATLLFTDVVEYGTNAAFEGYDPTKASTAQYDYTFEGWNSQDGESTAEIGVLDNITGEKTVYAAFSSTVRSYNVYFYNGSTLLKTDTVEYGSNASDSGIGTPTKDSTAQYSYTFVGWNSQNGQSAAEANVLKNITCNKTVYAAFSSTVRSYNVYFYNGSTLLKTESVQYGGTATGSGITTPTKSSTAQYTYSFVGWNSKNNQSAAEANVLKNITGSKTVYAAFSSTVRKYDVKFYNGSTLLKTESVAYGSNATGSGISTPTKASTVQYDYTFVGWNSKNNQTAAESGVLNNITAAKTVYAAFSQAWNGTLYNLGTSYGGFASGWTRTQDTSVTGITVSNTSSGALLDTTYAAYISIVAYTSNGSFNLNGYSKVQITYDVKVTVNAGTEYFDGSNAYIQLANGSNQSVLDLVTYAHSGGDVNQTNQVRTIDISSINYAVKFQLYAMTGQGSSRILLKKIKVIK